MPAVLYLIAIILLVVAGVAALVGRPIPGLVVFAGACALAAFSWTELKGLGD